MYVYMYKYYIYIYIYLYIYIIYLYLSLSLSLYIYIVIVCDHEITHKHTQAMQFAKTKYYIKFYSPFLWMGCNCLKARRSHYEETVYFLPEIPGTH